MTAGAAVGDLIGPESVDLFEVRPARQVERLTRDRPLEVLRVWVSGSTTGERPLLGAALMSAPDPEWPLRHLILHLQAAREHTPTRDYSCTTTSADDRRGRCYYRPREYRIN